MVVRRSREEWKIYGNVFDTFTIDVLRKLEAKGLFERLRSAIALGKEANVFTAEHRDGARIVKIYRLENCNFKKMHEYLQQDPRYMHTKPSKRLVVFAWCQREFRNLLAAREAGVACPTPYAFKENVLVMSLVGDEEAAPMLKDRAPEEPEAFLERLLADIGKLWRHGLVHGDLSAFNILNHQERPWFIDFSQASPTKAPNARELLERDLQNIASHFRKHGIDVDVEGEKEKITQ